LLALAVMTPSALFGALSRPHRRGDQALLAAWSLAAALAVTLSGGLSGPFAVFCLAPVFAGLAREADPRDAAVFGALAALLAFLADLLGLSLPPADPPARGWLACGAVLVVVLLGAGAVSAARRGVLQRLEMLDERLVCLKALLRELPGLALVITGEGATEEVLGPNPDIVPPESLEDGLLAAVVPETREAFEAALDKARRTGFAATHIALSARPARKLELRLRRMGGRAVLALLRLEDAGEAKALKPVPADTPPAPPGPRAAPAPPPAGDLAALQAALLAAEEARDEAQGLAASRMRFLANTSHELRTPLNAIMGFSDMMRARMFGDLAPKYGEYADLIYESGGHLLALINDILDVSKIEARRYQLNLERLDLREPLNDALRLVRLQADVAAIKLRARLPKTPLMVEADRRAVKQMCLNLLSNALKYTPSGGVVILSAQGLADAVEVIVADTGVGISPEDLKRIGRPFEQAGGADDRARGTGLGLSLVSSLARLHGGALKLESRLGAGTAATLRLPTSPPDGAGAAVEAA
jgi:cell cycle sensor histidine kinase DivJ